MTSVLFNSPSNNHSPCPTHHNHQFLNPNYHQPPSSSLTTHLFLNSNGINFSTELQHHPQYQHQEEDTQPQEHHQSEYNHGKRFEFSTWSKNGNNLMNSDSNQMKWMSPKMRVKLKLKKSDDDHVISNISHRQVTNNIDHEETYDSNSNSIPIRVCSDCNTSKTPLWRSGPRGPKSLCNACGIRQRKARRALAAAATASNSDDFNGAMTSVIAPLKVIKSQHKEHKKPSKLGQVTKYKKRQYPKQIMITTPPPSTPTSLSPSLSPSQTPSSSTLPSSPSPSSSPVRKNCVEEFLENLSKNLKFYHVLPQDEKEAAILLMALSCGYAHEP